MKVWCFYHGADLDGHCCGAVVRRWCEVRGHEFVPRGVNYGDAVDWMEGAGPDAQAVIADFTPEGVGAELTLKAMADNYEHGLVWIDHHKTAIDKVGQSDIDGARESGTAGCELAWRYFFPQEPMPAAVRLLGRYDVFDRSDPVEWEERILPFQYGMRARDTRLVASFEWDVWGEVLTGKPFPVARIVEQGKCCLMFERRNNARAAGIAAYDCVFEGMACCAMNAGGNSLALDAYAAPRHKMRILWRYALGRWRVSLYENGDPDVDCGKIAQRHGGGGHRGAAGFAFPGGISPLVYFPPAGEKDEGAGGGRGPGGGAQ